MYVAKTSLLTFVYRVGMLFLPNDDKLADEAKQIVEDVVRAEGRCKVVGWREVPVNKEVVARMAKITEPRIWQVNSASALHLLQDWSAC